MPWNGLPQTGNGHRARERSADSASSVQVLLKVAVDPDGYSRRLLLLLLGAAGDGSLLLV